MLNSQLKRPVCRNVSRSSARLTVQPRPSLGLSTRNLCCARRRFEFVETLCHSLNEQLDAETHETNNIDDHQQSSARFTPTNLQQFSSVELPTQLKDAWQFLLDVLYDEGFFNDDLDK